MPALPAWPCLGRPERGRRRLFGALHCPMLARRMRQTQKQAKRSTHTRLVRGGAESSAQQGATAVRRRIPPASAALCASCAAATSRCRPTVANVAAARAAFASHAWCSCCVELCCVLVEHSAFGLNGPTASLMQRLMQTASVAASQTAAEHTAALHQAEAERHAEAEASDDRVCLCRQLKAIPPKRIRAKACAKRFEGRELCLCVLLFMRGFVPS